MEKELKVLLDDLRCFWGVLDEVHSSLWINKKEHDRPKKIREKASKSASDSK